MVPILFLRKINRNEYDLSILYAYMEMSEGNILLIDNENGIPMDFEVIAYWLLTSFFTGNYF